MAREALAFDMYATLVDPIRIWKLLEQYIPHNGIRVAELWRQKQLEVYVSSNSDGALRRL